MIVVEVGLVEVNKCWMMVMVCGGDVVVLTVVVVEVGLVEVNKCWMMVMICGGDVVVLKWLWWKWAWWR